MACRHIATSHKAMLWAMLARTRTSYLPTSTIVTLFSLHFSPMLCPGLQEQEHPTFPVQEAWAIVTLFSLHFSPMLCPGLQEQEHPTFPLQEAWAIVTLFTLHFSLLTFYHFKLQQYCSSCPSYSNIAF